MEKDSNTTKINELKAQLTIVTGLLVLYFIFGLKGFLYAAGVIGVLCLFVPFIGKWIVILWFKLAHVLGWINTRILLSVIFYLFLFPIALLSRISKKNPLKLRKADGQSYYTERDHTYQKSDLKNIW